MVTIVYKHDLSHILFVVTAIPNFKFLAYPTLEILPARVCLWDVFGTFLP